MKAPASACRCPRQVDAARCRVVTGGQRWQTLAAVHAANDLPRYKTEFIVAIQAAYILMDQRACVDKAIMLLQRASDGGRRHCGVS